MDESGDTGTNFTDNQQPIFVLGSLLIEERKWKGLEEDYNKIIANTFNGSIPSDFELHAIDLVNRKNSFKSLTIEEITNLRNNLFQLIKDKKIPVFYRKIEKKKYQKYCEDKYGRGIKIDPYIMAFPFIGLKIDEYLNEKNELGIFIFDEHRSLADIEQSLKSLRLEVDNVLKMERVIEKGFFIDSSKSFALQLIDLVLYYIRKFEEFKIGKQVSSIHQEIFPFISEITISLDKYEKGKDIINWVGIRTKKLKRLPHLRWNRLKTIR